MYSPIEYLRGQSKPERQTRSHVPATVIVEMIKRPDNQPSDASRYELALKWHSCNEPIEVGMFDLSSLDVPCGSHVITEHRISEPSVMIQHPSFPNPEALQRVQEANAKPFRPIQTPPVAAAPQRSTRTLWLVGINVVLFLGLTGLADARRRTRPESDLPDEPDQHHGTDSAAAEVGLITRQHDGLEKVHVRWHRQHGECRAGD